MTVTLRLSTPFREPLGGKGEIVEQASSVRELIERVEKKHRGFKRMIIEPDTADRLRQHVYIYVNGMDARGLHGMDTALKNGDVVAVLAAVAGGKN